MYYGIKIKIGQTNRDPLALLDLARRQLDHLGRDGIVAKRRQGDRRYRQNGSLRFPLQNQTQVREVTQRIQDIGEPAIRVKWFRNRKRYPY